MSIPVSKGAPLRRHIWVDLLVYPAHTLPIAASPVMVGAALAAHDHVFAPMAVVLAFLGSWLIHLAGLITDDHEGCEREVLTALNDLCDAIDRDQLVFQDQPARRNSLLIIRHDQYWDRGLARRSLATRLPEPPAL